MFAFCSPSAAMLAQKIKLLAHDNKLRTGCLLNLSAAQPASLRNGAAAISTLQKGCASGACSTDRTRNSFALRIRL